MIHPLTCVQSTFCTSNYYYVILIVCSSMSFNMLMPPYYCPSRLAGLGYRHYMHQAIYNFFPSQTLIYLTIHLSHTHYCSLTSTRHGHNRDTSWLLVPPYSFHRSRIRPLSTLVHIKTSSISTLICSNDFSHMQFTPFSRLLHMVHIPHSCCAFYIHWTLTQSWHASTELLTHSHHKSPHMLSSLTSINHETNNPYSNLSWLFPFVRVHSPYTYGNVTCSNSLSIYLSIQL